jgi:hypothetical protein
MHVFTIIFLVLLFGIFIVGGAVTPFTSKAGRGWRRWLTTLGCSLWVVGATGVFGFSLSAAGGLNWLPSSFEWPVGYTSGVVSTPEGLHVVPHTSAGRIQIYDANWSFQTGWQLNAGGAPFKILRPAEGRIDVITTRGQWHYVFDLDGRLLSKQTYEPLFYGSFPDEGESVAVPTPPWLWVFSNENRSIAVLGAGIVILLITQPKPSKRKAAS